MRKDDAKYDVKYDVLGIGNAIVDVIAQTDEAFLTARHLHKGSMTLIDEATANTLYKAMGPAVILSGGSAANTLVGVAQFGGSAAFVGAVRNDETGEIFTHDIRAAGVDFSTPAAQSGPATAQCFVLVTPDGERTMSTYLGACVKLGPEDIDVQAVQAAEILYFEGYLWDPPRAKEAFHKAAAAARQAGRRIAFTLSDSFCVDRYRDEFLELMRSGVIDILFCNESELRALYQTEDADAAAQALGHTGVLGFVTRSEKGCSIVTREAIQTVPAAPIDRLVDTTGAGDLFAAGALFGLARNLPLQECGILGGLAAAEIIQHLGARPQTPLIDIMRQKAPKIVETLSKK